MGQCSPGWVPFSTAVPAGPRSGELNRFRPIPINAPKCLLEGGPSIASGEDGEGAYHPISCAIEARGCSAMAITVAQEPITWRARSPRLRGLRHRGAAGLVRGTTTLWRAPPPESGSAWITNHRNGLSLLLRPDSGGGAHPDLPRRIIANQRSFCCIASHLRICLPRLQGFVRPARKSACGGEGFGAGRWVGGQHPGGGLMAASRRSRSLRERKSFQGLSDQAGRAGLAAEAGFLAELCTKSSGSLRLTAPMKHILQVFFCITKIGRTSRRASRHVRDRSSSRPAMQQVAIMSSNWLPLRKV